MSKAPPPIGPYPALPQGYDDGGRSGGNLERPALQQLLADIGDGKVDVVVVYPHLPLSWQQQRAALGFA